MKPWVLIAVALCVVSAGCGDDSQTAPSSTPLIFSAILSPANEVPPIGAGHDAVQVGSWSVFQRRARELQP